MRKRAKRGEYIYMIVTRDKYELPLGVYDSPIEMAKATGKPHSSICCALSRKYGKSIYRKVKINEEEQ